MVSRRSLVWSIPAVTGLALWAAACGDPFGLPQAQDTNAVDTVSLYALDGTSVSSPSAFSIAGNQAVRTDLTSQFDFAFNIDVLGHPVFLPTGALGLPKGAALQVVTTPFDSITIAPGGGWVTDTAVAADSGNVLVARSQLTTCPFGAAVFLYAKLQVLRVDTIARRVDFEVLANQNCGYRGLEPGLPRR